MARRTVVVRRIPPPGQSDERPIVGRIVETNDGEFIATTQQVEGMVRNKADFDRYFMGYSNAYTEWLPEAAVAQPEQWSELVQRFRARRHKTPEEAERAFARLYAMTFGG